MIWLRGAEAPLARHGPGVGGQGTLLNAAGNVFSGNTHSFGDLLCRLIFRHENNQLYEYMMYLQYVAYRQEFQKGS